MTAIATMDQRFAAIAAAFEKLGISGPIPWPDFDECHWPCPYFEVESSQAYFDALAYGDELDRYHVTMEDIVAVLYMDPNMQTEYVEDFFAVRFGEAFE